MLTYEDMTRLFLKAAEDLGLTTHPEFWMNTRSLEREFSCICHVGTCEEAETHSACSVAFSWGTLDTALSLEGPAGVCEFFHDPDEDCPHMHTQTIPPLVLDLSYSLALHDVHLAEETLLSLAQLLRLRASEHSRRAVETRPGVSMILHENRLQPDMLTLQQRVEIPLWHPLGMRGLHDDTTFSSAHYGYGDIAERNLLQEEAHPEEWLPQVMVEICQDVLHVLAALDATLSDHSSDRQN